MLKACDRKATIPIILLVISIQFAHLVGLGGEAHQPQGPLPTANPYNVHEGENYQDETLRVDTNLITVSVSVMDREGRYVTNLRREDFQILDNGIEQEISYFAPVNEPFTILFLLDVSSSMVPNMQKLARAANTFLHLLHSEDQIIVVSFDGRTKELSGLSKVKDVWGKKEFALRPNVAGTRVYDAVKYALKRMSKIKGRKAIVLFSDGFDSGSLTTLKESLKQIEEQDTLIYTTHFFQSDVEISSKRIIKMSETALNYMRDLASKTGGRYYLVEEIADLEDAFRLVAEELSRQYSLGYYLNRNAEAGQRRQIKVKVRSHGLVIRTRDGYVVKP